MPPNKKPKTTNKVRENRSKKNVDSGGVDQETDFTNFSPAQFLKALRSFEQGDFSVADTINARQLLKALRAYNRGDFQVRLPEELTGIAGEISVTFNEIVSRHERILKEFIKTNKAVGKEGKISQRVEINDAVAGWGEYVESFNTIIDDLTQPISEISQVIEAVAKGDLTHPVVTEIEGRSLKGEFLRIAKLTNNMIGQLDNFSNEVTRVAREVGTDGSLGAKARILGVSGVWKDLSDNVNTMASNLTSQVRDIAKVTTAVSKGDLSQKITIEAKGEMLELKNIINSMVDFLNVFAVEVTRVAREVGTEGELGGQAKVEGVSGVWKELTSNVNTMATNLTDQVRGISYVIEGVANGNLTQKITVEAKGETLKLRNTINQMVDQLNNFAEEVTRIAKEVGTEGKLGGQTEIRGVGGVWKDLSENVNTMASNLTAQVREIAMVTTAVSNGDLTQKIKIDVKGEVADLKNTINNMVDQLNDFSDEVTRVAQEVGVDGRLGGQANVEGVKGSWKKLTDNVNLMASNLTDQVRNVVKVVTAVAKGDLSQQIEVEAKGEIADLKGTVNTMVEQLNSFSDQVTRIAKEVGTEGKLGGQADVRGVTGAWKELTDNVNAMATNLTDQVRNVVQVTTAVAKGDLTQKITVDAKGEILALKDTVNTMVDQLSIFAEEVTRVATEVGTEGKLGGQADVKGVTGTWRELTNTVNSMASNLTEQVRDIALVSTAVAEGDLSKSITIDAKGEVLELKNTINRMVEKLNIFSNEVTRLAEDVGTDGKLGGQARVEGVSGAWKALTDSVNQMASNLTLQVRNVVEVVTAVAKGDLDKTITIEAKGEILALKNTVNTMVAQLSIFADQVTQVSREVGTEGILGGQAEVIGVSGVWEALTDSVNGMANNLTAQVRDILQVTQAISAGDLTKKITVDVKGEVLELKEAIDKTTEVLNTFAKEVTRVAREVGIEGKLGGKADVPDAEGSWRELTDNVNSMAIAITEQVRDIAQVTTAVAKGDLSKKITVDARGEVLILKDTINTMVNQLSSFSTEVTRIARDVGTDGILGGQARVEGVSGAWKDLTDNVNRMAQNLTEQVRNIAEVATAISQGDLLKKITVDAQGEILELKNTINKTVDQLSMFSSEVTRVAKEVGTDGILGGQAKVTDVSGIWRELTGNVNAMATNLTDQVRDISKVAKGVASGDLTQKITVEVKGEVAELKDTINTMTHILSAFSEQTIIIAREVGVEGKLGGQAKVPGVAGTWKELTDNVNELAGNLTRQVRAISNVTTAVTKGDYKQSVEVEAKGEVADLRDNINKMVKTLSDTTESAQEQDWLKTNITKINALMQGKKDLKDLGQTILSKVCDIVDAKHGAFYIMETTEGKEPILTLLTGYGYKERKNLSHHFKLGEGLVGQSALEKQPILISNVDSDYIKINSGLGEITPINIIVLPIIFENEIMAIIELASLNLFSKIEMAFFDQFTEGIGIVITSVAGSIRTESLLKESQSLAEELQIQQKELKETNEKLEQQASTLRQSENKLKYQQEELQQTNEELEDKARMLAEQKSQVELKNTEVEQAKEALEQKAEQLTLTSKYKSEFLANMSHELRTPLNSLLILSEIVKKNKDNNLTKKQIESVSTIHNSGTELLNLINEILDLAKIESGTMPIEISDVNIKKLQDWAKQNFEQLATNKGLKFELKTASKLPNSIQTDVNRLQQILKNLLSNAFKFTEKGSVNLEISSETKGWSPDHKILRQAKQVIAFSIQDTGIGISAEKQKIIFEAFQQADGTTSRKYGGTGLGLSISREISKILGGEILLKSETNKGSTFIFYLPLNYISPPDQEQELNASLQISTLPSAIPRVSLKQDSEEKKVEANLFIPNELTDDRETIEEEDRVVLIIEDDAKFAQILLDQAREKGFKGLVSLRGDTGLAVARKFKPDAIVLDIQLPGLSGWRVMDLLKHDSSTRHIPIHVMSVEETRTRSLKSGAISFLKKPFDEKKLTSIFAEINRFMDKGPRQLLIVEDDEIQRKSLIELIGNGDVIVTAVGTGQEALKELKQNSFDCMVLDLSLPDISGFALIEEIKKRPDLINLPLIIYTGRELSKKDEETLSSMAETIIIKGIGSPERLLDETALFLHRVEGNLPESKRKILEQVYDVDPALRNRKVLIVDDDMRNIFALSSVLEGHEMKTLHADSGKEALEILKKTRDIELVLMDIMMPGMDGYETMQFIRKMKQYKMLPIIAVTAKAMKTDREKCIQAGASDYITKPVNTSQLLSLMRVWLYK